ncbi:hypothetical protein ACI65C_004965 [Semiaphis heraclei]
MTGLGLKTLKNRRGWNFDLQISGVDLQILADYNECFDTSFESFRQHDRAGVENFQKSQIGCVATIFYILRANFALCDKFVNFFKIHPAFALWRRHCKYVIVVTALNRIKVLILQKKCESALKIKRNKPQSGWSPSPKKFKSLKNDHAGNSLPLAKKSQTVRQLAFSRGHSTTTPVQKVELIKDSPTNSSVSVENINSGRMQQSSLNHLLSSSNLCFNESVDETDLQPLKEISTPEICFDRSKKLVTPSNDVNINIDNVFQNNMMRNVAFLKVELRQIKNNQGSILEQLESIQSHLQVNNKSYYTDNNLSNDDFHDCPLPLDNEVDLSVLEDKLSGDLQFKSLLVILVYEITMEEYNL